MGTLECPFLMKLCPPRGCLAVWVALLCALLGAAKADNADGAPQKQATVQADLVKIVGKGSSSGTSQSQTNWTRQQCWRVLLQHKLIAAALPSTLPIFQLLSELLR